MRKNRRTNNWAAQHRREIIVFTGGLVVFALCLMLWLVGSAVARQSYQEAAQAHAQATKAQLQGVADTFKPFVDQPNSKEAESQLNQLSTLLEKQLKEMPAAAKLLGIDVLSKDAEATRSDTKRQLGDMQLAAEKASQMLTYKQQVIALLKEVVGLKGADSAQINAQVMAWQKVHTHLKALTPPEATKDFHTALTASVESIAQTLETMPELYDKKDGTGFTAKQKELESKIVGLRALHEKLQMVALDYDKRLADPYRALQALVR